MDEVVITRSGRISKQRFSLPYIKDDESNSSLFAEDDEEVKTEDFHFADDGYHGYIDPHVDTAESLYSLFAKVTVYIKSLIMANGFFKGRATSATSF